MDLHPFEPSLCALHKDSPWMGNLLFLSSDHTRSKSLKNFCFKQPLILNSQQMATQYLQPFLVSLVFREGAKIISSLPNAPPAFICVMHTDLAPEGAWHTACLQYRIPSLPPGLTCRHTPQYISLLGIVLPRLACLSAEETKYKVAKHWLTGQLSLQGQEILPLVWLVSNGLRFLMPINQVLLLCVCQYMHACTLGWVHTHTLACMDTPQCACKQVNVFIWLQAISHNVTDGRQALWLKLSMLTKMPYLSLSHLFILSSYLTPHFQIHFKCC